MPNHSLTALRFRRIICHDPGKPASAQQNTRIVVFFTADLLSPDDHQAMEICIYSAHRY
ncbi:hypothetical protein [Chitinophaga sp. XS-30]|uniref:hypothetical protein n=1 Tax=Chitinophaga sp. XS-30 TaxID=2604421 RepID=UPI00143D9D88|nr:hypothetical protein [Chitinophaga sp. XS-30]